MFYDNNEFVGTHSLAIQDIKKCPQNVVNDKKLKSVRGSVSTINRGFSAKREVLTQRFPLGGKSSLFLFVYYAVCAACYLQGFGMFLYVGVYVAHAFFFEYLVDGY